MPGTLTTKPTYQDSAGAIANTNPVQLDSRGQAVIWGSGTYRQIVKDALGVTIWDQTVDAGVGGVALANKVGAGGAALIGYQNGTLDQFLSSLSTNLNSISALRGVSKLLTQRAFVFGYYALGDGGGGNYWYDPADTITTDNGCTVIVATDGGRWKLQLSGLLSVKQCGAKGDGVTDDTAAFQAALTAAGSVTAPYANYALNNLTINTNQALYANGATLLPVVGASCIVRMTGFKPILHDAYFNDQFQRLPLNFQNNAALIVKDSFYPEVHDTYFVNVYAGMLLTATLGGTGQVSKGTFNGLRFDTVTKRGIFVAANVNTCTFDNIRMFVGLVAPDMIPKSGCIGFQIVSTGQTLASGGNILSKIDIEDADTAFQFTDASLNFITDCIADTCCGVGYQVTGSSSFLKFENCWAGTCLVGYQVSNTANQIFIDGITCAFQGLVPPFWVGPRAFFNPGSPFDIQVFNTASVTIGSWFGGHSIYQDSTATVAFEGGEYLYGVAAAIGPSTTGYFGPIGYVTDESLTWTAPRDGVVYALSAQCGSAPGTGQSFAYTARIGLSSTGLAAVISNGGYSASKQQAVFFSKGQILSVQLATTSGAMTTSHRMTLSVKYY